MERIYFDKQIFSFLFKNTNETYNKFLTNLYANKKNFLYCYSHAHLLDLSNDKTDIKYRELEFMESLVGDNYISHSIIDKKTSCYLAKPLEAFQDVEKNDSISPLTDFWDTKDIESFMSEDQRSQFKKARQVFNNQRLDFGFVKLDDLTEEIKRPLSKILPIGVPTMTLKEWMEHLTGLLKTIEQDKSVYKDLRNIVDQYLNNGKFTVEYDSIDFNDDLKNSLLQKTFIEYVNSNLNSSAGKTITNHDFFLQAYFTLDLLGISKEPSKNVKFRNIINDSYHSYYGAYCDYVVSEDQGFLKKTRVLYKLLNIQTKVFHINEFIRHFSLLSKNVEIDQTTFFELLTNDLNNGIVLNSKPSIRYNRFTTTIKPYHQYFGYFNRIDCFTEDNKQYVYLYRKTKTYSYFNFFREYEGIVNKAVKIFGFDCQFNGDYKWPDENKKITGNKWEGRRWDQNTLDLLLDINEGTSKIGLLITKKEQR